MLISFSLSINWAWGISDSWMHRDSDMDEAESIHKRPFQLFKYVKVIQNVLNNGEARSVVNGYWLQRCTNFVTFQLASISVIVIKYNGN